MSKPLYNIKYNPEERELKYKEIRAKWDKEHREQKNKATKEYNKRARESYTILSKLWSKQLISHIPDQDIQQEIERLMSFKQ